ncbi:hypothetical protein F383_04247 [Gossypium arboreum]|uniref:Uncharacterized protein n=1 Tax=Gossypium arboreum TaxID=29729 RepID=A0A0B0P6F5_GOSAR|nr:hypothetical protein F383_04247 [Gossypium arboreum]
MTPDHHHIWLPTKIKGRVLSHKKAKGLNPISGPNPKTGEISDGTATSQEYYKYIIHVLLLLLCVFLFRFVGLSGINGKGAGSGTGDGTGRLSRALNALTAREEQRLMCWYETLGFPGLVF